MEVVLILLKALKGTNAADTLDMSDLSSGFKFFLDTKRGWVSSSHFRKF